MNVPFDLVIAADVVYVVSILCTLVVVSPATGSRKFAAVVRRCHRVRSTVELEPHSTSIESNGRATTALGTDRSATVE